MKISNYYELNSLDYGLYMLSIIYVRYVELLIADRYHEGKIRCPVHLSIGQEVVSGSIIQNITNNDKVIGSHRGHAHYLNCGGDLLSFFAELMGKQAGICGGRAGSQHLHDKSTGYYGSFPIIGSSLPIAAGIAFAHQYKLKTNLTICFIGNSTIENGQFFETLNIIAKKKLPILIVLEDNSFSTHTHKDETQSHHNNIKKIVESFNLEYYRIKESSIFHVFDRVKNILKAARSGTPILLEFKTIRIFDHVGPGHSDALNYSYPHRLEDIKKYDPIMQIRKKFQLLDRLQDFDGIVADLKTYIQNVYDEADKLPER